MNVLTDFQIESIVKLWEQTGSVRYIAKIIGCTRDTVRKYLIKEGCITVKKKPVKSAPVYDVDSGNRPYTNSTIFLICKWHYENLNKKSINPDKSIKKICNLL